ncbi:MAG: metallophosphoesterase [Capsulimonadales bacterium]|nr:metallophosphoesterase [Capsulimonadales bacterium]
MTLSSSPRRVWAIADTHLSFASKKSMERFGGEWRNHAEKLKTNIEKVVGPEDVLLLPGDLSWATRRRQAEPDLDFLAALPGIKVCCKGNHDFWWESDKPINHPGLHSPPLILDDGALGIAGSRGWYIPPSNTTKEAAKRDNAAIERETNRLQKTLDAIKDCRIKLVIMHYPPQLWLKQIKGAGVPLVAYGHVHRNSLPQDEKLAFLGEEFDGVKLYCVACDRIDFKPKLLLEKRAD